MTDPRPFTAAPGDDLAATMAACRNCGAVKREGDEELFFVRILNDEPAWMRAEILELVLGTTP